MGTALEVAGDPVTGRAVPGAELLGERVTNVLDGTGDGERLVAFEGNDGPDVPATEVVTLEGAGCDTTGLEPSELPVVEGTVSDGTGVTD